MGDGGWQHFDLQSELRLTFVYDTAILWKKGIGSPPQAELQGKLILTESCFVGFEKNFSFFSILCVVLSRVVVSHQHAHQWAGTFGGKLPH